MVPASGEVQLPVELRQRLQAVFDLDEAPTTVDELLRVLAASSLVPSPDELCAAQVSRHRLRIGDRTLYMNCAMDALLFPLLTGEGAEVASESPVSGSVVTASVSSKGIEFEPPEAVVSFGAARDPGVTDLLDALCPYINAFASAVEYETWAARSHEAVTVMLPLAEAYALARAVVPGSQRVGVREHRGGMTSGPLPPAT